MLFRSVAEALEKADAVLIAPSNPFLSVDPILAVPGMRALLKGGPAPIVAVSPIIDGKAVKGPTAKLMTELGLAVTNEAIVAHYGDLLDGLLVDAGDGAVEANIEIRSTDTLMTDDADRERVAREALLLAKELVARCAGPR